MSNKRTVSLEEELKLRRTFELGAYLMITQYLAKTYGLDELRRFAKFWAESASAGERRNIVKRSEQEFLAWEAKIEKAWVGREAEKLDKEEYVGVVKNCPIRSKTNQRRKDLPIDFFCDYICSVIYPEGYRLLGFQSTIEKTKNGCQLVIRC